MKQLVLSPDAVTDIAEIARYSKREWGEKQARLYGTRLAERLIKLKTSARLGRLRLDIDPIVRSVKSGRHLIFFDVEPDRVVVLRILHESMDTSDRVQVARSRIRSARR